MEKGPETECSQPSDATILQFCRKVPPFLIRTSSTKSNGTNDNEGFKPQIYQHDNSQILHNLTFNAKYGSLKTQLQDAIFDHNMEFNPFIFETDDLMYTIQHGIRQSKSTITKRPSKEGKTRKNRSAGENIRFTLICPETARNQRGEPITFRSVLELAELLRIALFAKFKHTPMDFSDVWVTTDCIKPGSGSYSASFDELKEQGLYDLFPEWKVNARLGNPGLQTPLTDMRTIWFAEEIDMPEEEINLAAKLALLFHPWDGSQNEAVPMEIFAWFLAMRNQKLEGDNLQSWLKEHSVESNEPFRPSETFRYEIEKTDKTAESNESSEPSQSLEPFEAVQLPENSTEPHTGRPEWNKYLILRDVLLPRKVLAAQCDDLDSDISELSIITRQNNYRKVVKKRNEKEKEEREKEEKERKERQAVWGPKPKRKPKEDLPDQNAAKAAKVDTEATTEELPDDGTQTASMFVQDGMENGLGNSDQ